MAFTRISARPKDLAWRAGDLLGEAGLSATKAELHQLLRALIENPGLVERWSAGDDIAALSTDAARATDERVGASTRSSAP